MATEKASADAMERHNQLEAKIIETLTSFHRDKTPARVDHGSSYSTRSLHRDQARSINTKAMDQVIRVDPQEKIAVVEPNVSMDKILEACLEHNLLPLIVTECPGITVGGSYAGLAGSSSSFRVGAYHDICRKITLIGGDGKRYQCSRTENEELYYASRGSCGTLGIVTLLEVELREASPYVVLNYQSIHSIKEALDMIESEHKGPWDFLDGFMFAHDFGVVCTGQLSDKVDGKIQTSTKPGDPWFYQQVRSEGRARKQSTHTVPLRDYLFRHDRGAYWMGEHAFGYFRMPLNRITRRLLNRFMHTRPMCRALHFSGLEERYACQDYTVRIPPDNDPSGAIRFFEKVHEVFEMYPVYLCPWTREGQRGGTGEGDALLRESSSMARIEKGVNFGVYGAPKNGTARFVERHKEIEETLFQENGHKMLYAVNFYSEEEFWKRYDKAHHDSIREKYGATSLPNIYQKISDPSQKFKGSDKVPSFIWKIWPCKGLYGVWKVL